MKVQLTMKKIKKKEEHQKKIYKDMAKIILEKNILKKVMIAK